MQSSLALNIQESRNNYELGRAYTATCVLGRLLNYSYIKHFIDNILLDVYLFIVRISLMLTPSGSNLYIDLCTPQPLWNCGATEQLLKIDPKSLNLWVSWVSITWKLGSLISQGRRNYIELSFPQPPYLQMLSSYHLQNSSIKTDI